MTELSTAERQERVRDTLMVFLAINSGATDAIAFLCLGGAFTSVMTGNMVLLGVSASRLDSSLAVHTGAAIIYFVAGCAVGTRIAGNARPDDPVWPRSVTVARGPLPCTRNGQSLPMVPGWEGLTGDLLRGIE